MIHNLDVKTSSERLVIFFLSDALIRNQWGQYSTAKDDICACLADALENSTITCEDAFIGATLLGGFNRKWGLPIPQATAIQMGSVLVINVPPPGISTQVLQKLEEQGIGDRRAEGFGRIAINGIQAQEFLESPFDHPSAPDSVALPPDGLSYSIAKEAVMRLWHVQLENALIKSSSNLSDEIKGVSGSQLNRLIEALQNARQTPWEGDGALAKQELSKIKDLLKKIQSRKAIRDQFKNARIEGKSLLDWLEECVDPAKLAGIWQKLEQNPTRPHIGNVKVQETDADALAYEYSLRLAIAVLARAVKKIPSKETDGGNE